MVPAYFISAVIYANLLMILSMGFTFTYLTSKVPNFAYGSISSIGLYLTFTIVKLYDLNPYFAMPLAFIFCSLISMLIYRFIIQTLKMYGATLISLSIVTIALEVMILAFINVYADYLRGITGAYARFFLLRRYDLHIFGFPGVLLISILYASSTIFLIHYLLTRTKFGIAMRATVENPSLASIMGVNVEVVSLVSWALTGGLAGVAGSLLPLWFQCIPETGSKLMTSVFASSVLGGLSSIYGAMIGGYIVGLTEILGTIFLMDLFGTWVSSYRPLIPLIVMSVLLLKAPRGLLGLMEYIQFEKKFKLKSILPRFTLGGKNDDSS